MIKRILSLLLGIGLIAVVVYLGLRARNEQAFVIWFGLAAAILTPIGLTAIGYSLSAGNRQVLERLSKVPEIERLISEAQSQEEKIRLLAQERSRLIEIVELEARKQSLITRKESLEQDSIRILKELEAIDEELSEVDINVESSPVTEEIRRLQDRINARREGDLIFRFGSRRFIVRRSMLFNLPFGGVLFEYYKLGMSLNNSIYDFLDLFRTKSRYIDDRSNHKPDI